MDVPVKNELSFASPFEQFCYLAIGREESRYDILQIAQSAAGLDLRRQIDGHALDIASLELSTESRQDLVWPDVSLGLRTDH
jgi:hypothetical protein